MARQAAVKNYRLRVRRLMLILIICWFVVSFGCGIFWVETLNKIRFGGFKLGFWFAQQGAIYAFIVMIFYYAHVVGRFEREFLKQSRDES